MIHAISFMTFSSVQSIPWTVFPLSLAIRAGGSKHLCFLVSHLKLLHFTGDGHWKFVNKSNVARDLEVGNLQKNRCISNSCFAELRKCSFIFALNNEYTCLH